MDGWFKGLVAVTCAAVLVALGWWGWSERQRSVEQTAAEVAVARAARVQAVAEAEFRVQELRRDCEADLEEWYDGDRAVVLDRYGGETWPRIKECRSLVGRE